MGEGKARESQRKGEGERLGKGKVRNWGEGMWEIGEKEGGTLVEREGEILGRGKVGDWQRGYTGLGEG